MLFFKSLLVAYSFISSYAVAQDAQEELLNEQSSVPVFRNPRVNDPMTGDYSFKLKWDVKHGRDRTETYKLGWCYALSGQPNIQGYTITAGNEYIIYAEVWEKFPSKGNQWCPNFKGPTSGKVSWGPHKVETVCLSGVPNDGWTRPKPKCPREDSIVDHSSIAEEYWTLDL
ncbi:hypothetical protein BDV38DRAFT_232095 [Aspergillus pseudotamarii]|uniref:Aegerolysin type hemolysin n=1 Tax=Aspergillus pseudotamarii TaxID=132259 RepID=A0A5N6TBW4_ASPPS|nr:uncharacterized protein BDV38DRAFT_232095 [Aspergillus pseudotamarii]KAE8143823.1 hypothetical protein BDV38DRAFT_232095 [Aspergillus pseudotamarii]